MMTLMKVSWISSKENSVAVGSRTFSSSFVVVHSSRSGTGRGESFMLWKSGASPASESALRVAIACKMNTQYNTLTLAAVAAEEQKPSRAKLVVAAVFLVAVAGVVAVATTTSSQQVAAV